MYDGWFYDIGNILRGLMGVRRIIGGLPGESVFEAMRYVGVSICTARRAGRVRAGGKVNIIIDAIARQGVPVYAARMLRIDHANLPAYGLEWH